MIPLIQKQNRGLIFPESIYPYVPHLPQISAQCEDCVVPMITENETYIEEVKSHKDWCDSMMGELGSENRGLYLVIAGLREKAVIDDSIWRFFGEWLFALQYEYRLCGRSLPLVTTKTIDAFQQQCQGEDSLLDAMFNRLIIEVGSSNQGWCSTLRDTTLLGTHRAKVIKALCTVALLLDLAAAENDLTPGTTPRSD